MTGSHPVRRLRAAVIVAGEHVSAWQALAIREASDLLDVRAVLVAGDVPGRTRKLQHGLYYLLRATVLRARMERPVALGEVIPAEVPRLAFTPLADGVWHRFPPDLVTAMADLDLDVVIRFGMGLIREPDALPTRLGLLSFHHGDPAAYRGRPAGFYEILDGARTVGTIVQRLSDELDAGAVLALGHSRAIGHSYRATMDGVYRNGARLLRRALLAAQRGERIEHPVDGRVTRLPTNATALRFLLVVLRRLGRHVLYGLGVRKEWRVAVASGVDLDRRGDHVLTIDRALPCPTGFRFLADPLPTPEGDLLAEGLDRRTGLGAVIRVGRDGTVRRLAIPGTHGHLSYPFTFRAEGTTFLLPEMATCGPQRAHPISGTSIGPGRPLIGLEDVRLIDPTLHQEHGTWWLFAGLAGSEYDLLNLWSAPDPFGPFLPHPLNPVVHDARRARPAGPLLRTSLGLLRPGQVGCGRYGDGITLSRITRLTADEYAEEPVATLSIAGRRGPHTISTRDGIVTVDAYRDRVSPLAAVERLAARAAGRRRDADPGGSAR